jgi:hypothetical protein
LALLSDLPDAGKLGLAAQLAFWRHYAQSRIMRSPTWQGYAGRALVSPQARCPAGSCA